MILNMERVISECFALVAVTDDFLTYSAMILLMMDVLTSVSFVATFSMLPFSFIVVHGYRQWKTLCQRERERRGFT